jgi:hypothetical protein
LVYADEFEDQKDVLVYHMWTQFYLDDEWVNLDAALGLGKMSSRPDYFYGGFYAGRYHGLCNPFNGVNQ